MAKSTCYIREFTAQQDKQMEIISRATGYNTNTKILFHALEKYDEHEKDIKRLKRIIDMKETKIHELKSQLQWFESHAKTIKTLSDKLNKTNK
ncbi:hypothetical protein [Flavobacterium sp. UBA4197]|uniref:hypothetical protein n=1 Tax=Flavobacterium sp. UBA4197 TaxID=1946546 RepID=UPI00257BD637|nr:hypothetical protein [Flavobacterium sp. UBA4197]